MFDLTGLPVLELTMPAETPDYLRVVADIRSKIEQGELRPGDKLPPKREMADTYQVSESTMDRVIVLLRETGYVRSWQGKGVYVAERAAPDT